MQSVPHCSAPAGGGGKHLGYFSTGSCSQACNLWVLCIYFSSRLCCPLRFQNSPQTGQSEGFLVFGNFFSFTTPSPGRVSIPNSLSLFLYFIFSPTQRQWAPFLGAWCPLPAFRSCFVEFAQLSNVLLMNLLGRKWSPCPIPLPSQDRPLDFLSLRRGPHGACSNSSIIIQGLCPGTGSHRGFCSNRL